MARFFERRAGPLFLLVSHSSHPNFRSVGVNADLKYVSSR
jgi:hypothetical protein